MGYKIKEDTKLPKEKKKLSGLAKFFITFFSLVIGIPAIVLGVAFACFYDGNHKEVAVHPNYETKEVLNDVIVSAFDDAKVYKSINIGIKENQLNQLLYNAIASNETASQFIKGLYVDVNDGVSEFVLEADVFNFFKTRLHLFTKFEVNNEEETLEFKITNIQLGKINGLNKAIGLITNAIKLPDLTDLFKQSGFNLKVDLNNLKLTYKMSDFYNDLSKLIGADSGTFSSIINEILNQGVLREVGAKDDTFFGIYIDTSKLEVTSATLGVDDYVVPEGYFDLAISEVLSSIKGYLNSNKIERADADLVAKYMMLGDSLLTSEEIASVQGYVDAHVFDGKTIPYFSYDVAAEDQLKTVVESQLPSVPTLNFTVDVTTEKLDKMLKGSTTNGVITTLVSDIDGSGTNYKINYICSDRVTTVVKDNVLYLIVNMNLNGVVANVTLKCLLNLTKTTFGQMVFDIDSMYLGDLKVLDGTKDAFMAIITKALGSAAFGGLFSVSNTEVTASLKDLLESHNIKDTDFDFTVTTVDSTKDSAGAIRLELAKK